MAKYRKKPIVIEPVQFNNNPAEDPDGVFRRPEDNAPYVVTIHDQRCYLSPGDWIIPEPDGIHHYPCKPDIFEITYDLIEEDEIKEIEVSEIIKAGGRLYKHLRTFPEIAERLNGVGTTDDSIIVYVIDGIHRTKAVINSDTWEGYPVIVKTLGKIQIRAAERGE